MTNANNRRIRFIERFFDIILTSLSSSSDENYKCIDLHVYRVDDTRYVAKINKALTSGEAVWGN